VRIIEWLAALHILFQPRQKPATPCVIFVMGECPYCHREDQALARDERVGLWLCSDCHPPATGGFPCGSLDYTHDTMGCQPCIAWRAGRVLP
jgi:hypothetical protein